jgi:hypothetical protein
MAPVSFGSSIMPNTLYNYPMMLHLRLKKIWKMRLRCSNTGYLQGSFDIAIDESNDSLPPEQFYSAWNC